MEDIEMKNSQEMPTRAKGYPNEGLVVQFELGAQLDGIELPDGPWVYNNSPLPSLEESAAFAAAGYSLDSIGRPLHPWAKHLTSAEEGGAIVGKGAYWGWGPNFTADPVIITTEQRPRILLIERADTNNPDIKTYALPGGFVDPGEDPLTTARRETEEETELPLTAEGQLLYQGPVADPRATLNAWPETSAYLFRVPPAGVIKKTSETLSVDWFPIDELPENFYGSHRTLIDIALDHLRFETAATRSRETLRGALANPEELENFTPIQMGHMAYSHAKVSFGGTTYFIKQHVPANFTDPEREKHSRNYLVKEHETYKHLESQGFKAIPRQIELIDDTLLSMEHFNEEDGWYWRAPRDQLDTYVTDAFASFDALQATAPIKNPSYAEDVAPTYETFWQEGWDAIDDDLTRTIIDRITEFSGQWQPHHQAAAFELIEALPNLREHASMIQRDQALYPAHNDARQSNIAWHATEGSKLVDWSWADLAPLNADATMLLIDLAKSQHDISSHLDRFNPDYALTVIGFLLYHGTWKTRDGSSTVREHQIATASIAYQLLKSREI